MKVVVLMSRLSDYMLNCFISWHEESGVEMHIVRMKVDTFAAPFNFGCQISGISLYAREDMSAVEISELVDKERPDLIICFGWFDLAYVAAIKARPVNTIAVMTMDNQWHNSSRQLLGAVYCRFFLLRHFDFVWVPGTRQYRFARVLGFPEARIRKGLYVANDTNFTPLYLTIGRAPKKRLVFVGRYIDAKGIRELWEAFELYHTMTDSNLELLCVGTGPLYESQPKHPLITHLGFIQPKDFREILAGGGIFILPSKFEPWGVVVHEFALAGFPLVLSDAVGAADYFLTPENGHLIKKVSRESLLEAIAFVDNLDDTSLSKMSAISRAKAVSLTVADWCHQANEFLEMSKE